MVILRGEAPLEMSLLYGNGDGDGDGNGDGDGYGDGNGDGDGDGDGNGDGYGNGYGNGDGYGNGYGYGYGDGYGDGDGYGNGKGNGYGDGNGDGYGNGYGYGYGNGYGDGNGDGYGDEISCIRYWSRTLHPYEIENAVIAYWRSTEEGVPANGGSGTVARIGLVETIKGPLEICTKNALHATLNPPKWKGERIWIVAMYPPLQVDGDKIGSLKREFIAEADFAKKRA